MGKTAQKSTEGGLHLEPHQIIMNPLVTEKGTHQFNRYNAYPFRVHPQATKEMIKDAIHHLFNVRVLAVRTQNRLGKTRRYKNRLGRMANWKRAIVKLHIEDRIEFF